MNNRRATIRATYSTPIGKTVKTLDKPKALKKGVSEKTRLKTKETYSSKPAAIMAWYDDITSRKLQLALHKAGKGDYKFEQWEFEYIPNLFREAKRLIKNTKYLKLRLEAIDLNITLLELYRQKRINTKHARYKEKEEAELVFWAIEHFEKIYGGKQWIATARLEAVKAQ